jgi:hypothetical protein
VTDGQNQPTGVSAKQQRAALYVDGFNLYHPINRSGQNHLKWASLWRLGELICERGGQQLVKVVFCTAVPKIERDAGKHDRHIRFNSAQEACGVQIVHGHYVPEPKEVDGVPTGEQKWVEKQTDLNVALQLLFDGLDDVYDIAFLLSADTDQVATARVFNERLRPFGKQLVGVAPPNRKTPAGYGGYGVKGLTLKMFDLERCVMGERLQGPNKVIIRPAEYAPPIGWLHPNDRPKNKPSKPPKNWGKPVRA